MRIILVASILLLAAAPALAEPPKAPPCDAAHLIASGDEHLMKNENAAALAAYEKAYACKADAVVLPKLVLAACKVPDARKAQRYYDRCKSGPHNTCAPLVARCESLRITLK